MLDLGPIKDRELSATAGPWKVGGRFEDVYSESYPICWMSFDHDNRPFTHENCTGLADRDADFIAHARQDVPALIAEVEQLRAENAKYKEIQDKVESYRRAIGLWKIGDKYSIEENGQKLTGEIVDIKPGHPLVYVVKWGDGEETEETFEDLPQTIEP